MPENDTQFDGQAPVGMTHKFQQRKAQRFLAFQSASSLGWGAENVAFRDEIHKNTNGAD